LQLVDECIKLQAEITQYERRKYVNIIIWHRFEFCLGITEGIYDGKCRIYVILTDRTNAREMGKILEPCLLGKNIPHRFAVLIVVMENSE